MATSAPSLTRHIFTVLSSEPAIRKDPQGVNETSESESNQTKATG
jgi:hypothetical protein